MDRVFDSLELEISVFAPEKPGVYAVYFLYGMGQDPKNARLVYIGSSKNIKKRIQSTTHPYGQILIRKKRGLSKLSVFCKYIECDDFKEVERILISLYKPILNKTLKGHG